MNKKKIIIIIFILGVFEIYSIIYYFINWAPIEGLWKLAYTASTISLKRQYVESFIVELEKNKLAKYGDLLIRVPNTKTENNIKVLKDFYNRLVNLEKLNETTFEYSTALQQLKVSEEKINEKVILNLKKAYFIKNNVLLVYFDFVCILIFAIFLGFIIYYLKNS